MEDLLKRLEQRIKIVRTARIEAAKRFKKEHEFYRRITMVYSILVTCLSIWFVISKANIDSLNLTSALLTMATFVTLFTMYTSIKNPGEKVARFQSNYMELTRLLSEIQSYIKILESGVVVPDLHLAKMYSDIDEKGLTELTLKSEYDKFAKRYASLLTQSDNHDFIDYWRAIVQEQNEKTSTAKILKAEKHIRFFEFWDVVKKLIASLSIVLIFALFYLLEFVFSWTFPV